MSDDDVFDSAPRLVNIGKGRRLAVQVQGKGEATVVFEGGGAGFGIDGWADVDKQVAQFATVVTYDRLGVGASEPLLREYPTVTDHADNLARLLDALPVKQPVILVGWSWGGVMAQQFAALYPQKVAGLLLLDPSSFVYDDSDLATAGMPAPLMRFMQARAMARMRRSIIAAAKGPKAKAKFIKEMSARVGPRHSKERMDREMGIGVDLSHGQAVLHSAVARVDTLVPLMRSMRAMTAEMARTIAARGLPEAPTILLISTFFGDKPPAKMLKLVDKKFGAYEVTAAKRGAEVRKLKDISHQIPDEAPEECVRAVRDLIARGKPSAT